MTKHIERRTAAHAESLRDAMACVDYYATTGKPDMLDLALDFAIMAGVSMARVRRDNLAAFDTPAWDRLHTTVRAYAAVVGTL